MSTKSDTWTRAHDLALVYVALAYGTDSQLTDAELAAITDHLRSWRDDFAVEDVQEVVMESMAIFLEHDAEVEVPRSIQSLSKSLTAAERERALQDIVHIAEADGVLLNAERSLIRTLARSWGLKALSEDLISHSSARREETPDWTVFHDLSLIYLVMAHSTDAELSKPEIDAIEQRLGDWKQDLTDEDVRSIIRSTLQFYAQGPDQEALEASVASVKRALPVIQRLAALDDLVYIAEADGSVNDHERTMIETLAKAWGVAIRLNGRARISPLN